MSGSGAGASSITDAIELVVIHRINCLPMADGGMLRGLVTTTDLLRALHQILQERRSPVSRPQS